MATVIIDRGSDVKLQNTPNIDGMIYFNTDNHTIILDNGTDREVYGGTIPMLINVSNVDGASNNNTYSALAAKNGFCIKSNVADSIANIEDTTEIGRPVGCVGFKSIIGTSDISNVGSTVKNAISNIGNRLAVDNNTLVFDYQNGKWGFNTSESRGADTFHPFSSTSLSTIDNYNRIENSDIVATNIDIKVNTTTDSSTTALPINFTTGNGVVTYHSGRLYTSGSNGVSGGIIHLFDDTNHGKPEGTHSHYILMDKWYTATNKTPIGDTYFYPTTDNIQVGLPISIPYIMKKYNSSFYAYEYRRYDRLKYLVCRNAQDVEMGNTCVIDFFEYGSTIPFSSTVDYTNLSWVKQSWSLVKQIPSNVTNYQIGSQKTMVWFKNKLHIFGGTYVQNGEVQRDINHYIIYTDENGNFDRYVETPIQQDFINYDIYATLVHNDKIYIFYDNSSYPNSKIFYITYDENGFGESGEFTMGLIDGQSQWVEYNGEIHVLGGNTSNKLHIGLVDSDFNTNTTPVKSYADLKYPFRDSVACVAPPIKTSYEYTSDSLEEASMLSIPTYIHYMGTAQANSSSTNYRKKHYQIQNTYLTSIYNNNVNVIDIST